MQRRILKIGETEKMPSRRQVLTTLATLPALLKAGGMAHAKDPAPAVDSQSAWPDIRASLFGDRKLEDGGRRPGPRRSLSGGRRRGRAAHHRGAHPADRAALHQDALSEHRSEPGAGGGRLSSSPGERQGDALDPRAGQQLHQHPRGRGDLGRAALHGREVRQGGRRLLGTGLEGPGPSHGPPRPDEAPPARPVPAERGQHGRAAHQPSQLHRDADGPAHPQLDPAGLCDQGRASATPTSRSSGSTATSRSPRTRPSPSTSCRPAPARSRSRPPTARAATSRRAGASDSGS